MSPKKASRGWHSLKPTRDEKSRNKLVHHPGGERDDEGPLWQVAAQMRERHGEGGYIQVLVHRGDADDGRQWSSTAFDHQNRVLVSSLARTRSGAYAEMLDALDKRGYDQF